MTAIEISLTLLTTGIKILLGFIVGFICGMKLDTYIDRSVRKKLEERRHE